MTGDAVAQGWMQRADWLNLPLEFLDPVRSRPAHAHANPGHGALVIEHDRKTAIMRTPETCRLPTSVRALGALALAAVLAIITLAIVVDGETGDGESMLGTVASALEAANPVAPDSARTAAPGALESRATAGTRAPLATGSYDERAAARRQVLYGFRQDELQRRAAARSAAGGRDRSLTH